nr:hypothetical protein [Tanacetum cinerariifolium]
METKAKEDHDHSNAARLTSMNDDVVTELFGISLSTPKDIDVFISDLEASKYQVWSELTREKHQEVMNTIWSIWNKLVAENPIEMNVNPMPSKVSASDPIVQFVFINEKPSSYVGAAVWSKPKASNSKANFRSLVLENIFECAKLSIPIKVYKTVSTRFDQTLYGYFIGKRIVFSVVEYYARNNWGKYGLIRIMMNSKCFFFFKFKASKGLDDILENGPWIIYNSPIILKKWSMDTRKHIMLDSYTSSMCIESWGRSSFSCCLIEFDAEDVLKESLTMGVPLIEGTGYTIETITIVYEWQPPRCDLCKIFSHIDDQCPKKVSSPTIVVTSNIATVQKNNDRFKTMGKKKKKKGNSKSTSSGQFVGPLIKQNLWYETKANTSAPKKGATNVGNASKSASMLKTSTSSEKGKITMSNAYSTLDDESEEDVENVYDELANLFPNSKTGGSSSFTAGVMHKTNEEEVVEKLKFVAKGETKCKPKYGMKIPEAILSQIIKEYVDYMNYLNKSNNAQLGAPTLGKGRGKGYVSRDPDHALELAASINVKVNKQRENERISKARYVSLVLEKEVNKKVYKAYNDQLKLKHKAAEQVSPDAQLLLDLKNDHDESIKESVKVNVLNEAMNQLSKFVPKIVSDYVQPCLGRTVLQVNKKNMIELFKSPTTSLDSSIEYDLKYKLYELAQPFRKKRSHDDHGNPKNSEWEKKMNSQRGTGESSSKKDKTLANSTNFERFFDVDEPRQEHEEEGHHDVFSGNHAHWFNQPGFAAALDVLITRVSQSRQHDTLVRLPMDLRLKIDLGKSYHKFDPFRISQVTYHKACLMLALKGFPSSL